ncbi:nuclease-related domain-containing protein [Saliterribacillus persicus]|uniref:Nuclease-like protein n=1 Tax=Saliterribacillus persicus TaxID=930114 RepID=A0A368X9F7_9BACI|nr:nuclease-related domain-containing protein [Saliterribacillus persicus]RCW62674.1 nuclease-like protein [Saliterribacillus persicus]
MVQLIKLENYISRYEKDIYHYPSQFTRLKQENWKRLKSAWEFQNQQFLETDNMEEETAENNFFNWRSFFKKREEIEEEKVTEEDVLPQTEEELKQYFLDTLLPFQLKWASTTISEMSFLDRTYYQEPLLKYFLQRFPDTFLLMYNPVFDLKNSPMEADIILISPLGIEIIRVFEWEDNQLLIAGDDRTWYKEENQIQSKIFSPLLSLKRTEKILKSIFKKHDLDFPVTKVVLTRKNKIEFGAEPYQTKYIDIDSHDRWLMEKRSISSPLKHRQLKVADYILRYVETKAMKRPEWDQQDQTETF